MEKIKVTITKKGEESVKNNHPWIFDEEIINVDNNYNNGDIVDVYSTKNKYLGTGFINDNSKIRIRIISRNSNDTIDSSFWKRRIEYALNYRLQVMDKEDLNAFRLIFGEADGFPGLTVDKFNDVLVCEVLSLAIDIRKDICNI